MRNEERGRSPAQPGLTIEHDSVLIDGKSCGLAVSLGSGFVLYTTDNRLQALDGRRFDAMTDLRLAIEGAIVESEKAGVAA